MRLSRSPSQAMAEHHSCHVQTWAQVGPKRSQSPRGATNWEQRQLGGLYPVGTELSEQGQVDKSRASWRLKSNTEEDQSSSRPSSFWPAPLKATRSLHEPGWSSSASTPPAEDEEFRTNPLYHTSEGPEEGPPQQGGLTYSEVLQRPTGPGRSERTYEQIPKEPEQGNTYESVEEVKTKKESTWGRNVSKRRRTSLQTPSGSRNRSFFLLFAEQEMATFPSWFQEEMNFRQFCRFLTLKQNK